MFRQDAVHVIELENWAWNTANWTQGIDDTASLMVAKAKQWERRQEDIDAATEIRNESTCSNKQCFEQEANLQAEELQIGDIAHVHESKIEPSHCAILNARWQGPYRVTEISQIFGTNWLAELDGAELAGRIEISRLRKFITRTEGVHHAREISMPNTTKEEDSEEFNELEVQAVAGWKSIKGWWMYSVEWKDLQKRLWVQEDDMAECKLLVDAVNSAHWVPGDNLCKQWWDWRMGGEAKGGRSGEGRRSMAWTITKRIEDTSCEMEREYRIRTIAWIAEMEGDEIFLLDELHPCYTKNCYHSPLTLW